MKGDRIRRLVELEHAIAVHPNGHAPEVVPVRELSDVEAVDLYRRIAHGQVGGIVLRPDPVDPDEEREIIASWRELAA